MVAALDWLGEPSKSLAFADDGPETSHGPVNIQGLEVEHLNCSYENELLPYLREKLQHVNVEGTHQVRYDEYYDQEAPVNAVFHDDVLGRCNDVFRAMGLPLRFRYQARLVNGIVKPDFVLQLVDEHGKPICDIMPGEGKFPTVLPFDDLVQAVWDGITNAHRAVSQQGTYMNQMVSPTGFLGTQKFTFLMERRIKKRFAIGMGVASTATKPSAAEVVMYAALKAYDNYQAPPGAPPEQPQQLAVGSSTGTGAAPGPLDSRRVTRKMTETSKSAAGSSSVPSSSTLNQLVMGLVFYHKLAVKEWGYVYCGSYLGQEVAIKAADAANAKDVVQLLQHEARAYQGPLALLQGKHVPRLVEAMFTSDHALYMLLTSYIHGDHASKQSSDAALDSAAEALTEVHSKKVGHGDICARNIMVQGNQAFLIDFGCWYTNPSHEQQENEMRQLYSAFGQVYVPSPSSTTSD